MKSTVRVLFVLLALVPILSAVPASATTYQMVSDQTLADQAPVIVEARVVAAEPAPVVGRPATDYQVEVERVIKGDLAGSTVMVRIPGGIGTGGIGLKIWGAPRFREGDRTLLFLSPGKDGVYRPLHLMLGAFHVQKVGDRDVAVRELSETVEVGPQGLRPGSDIIRDFDGFSAWLHDRSLGVPRPQDYMLATSAGVTEKGLGQATEKYTLLRWPQDDMPVRWFRFDQGQALDWRVHNGGQPGLGLERTVNAFQVALQAWNDDPGSNIRYNYVGTTDASGGLVESDDTNTILFDDPYRDDPDNAVEGTFRCGRGGVIAIGGPYFTIATRSFRGEKFHEAVEADIVTNDGTDCFFQDNVSVAEEVFAHELGHTLGLGHSEEDDAVMRATAHDDNRGARLHGDDRAAVAFLYSGGTATRAPAAPKKLVAKAVSGTVIRLTWRDMSNNEDGFHVEVKQGNRFVELGVADPNTKQVEIEGLTAGKNYIFRIRSGNSAGFSAYSNQARATTPRARRNRQR
ncbi:MAG TPA: matrixin family metalloprotease [Thermoanaerobaculia bacterium]|nr:matrixin family metalloprotease [Thermoanaerobaculia bacterium]